MSESPAQPDPSSDDEVVDRLVPLWLREAQPHEASAAHEAQTDWKNRRLSTAAARELADWVTARVTDSAFNEEEGPTHAGPAPISVADKAAVHRWLLAHGHTL
ncbi:hypothetical protein [Streptomyces sp. cmx-4-9]|uniref:hypothetical protein n=1 Tax=Streptomyces sp. cmx-4-9 TaxID=2790941 RepID=UPI0039818EAC